MKFTVALIAKNEEHTIPRLLKTLKGVDEVIVVDTGSTDKTVEVAKSFGATVYEHKFDINIDEKLKKEIDEIIGKNDIKIGDTAFNFAEARNWIAKKAKHDMIFMPDCDEIVEWNVPEVEKLLDEGIDRLEYNFVFSWDNDGNPLIQFIHSKFYNRNKFHWVRFVHEVLAGEGKSQFTEKIFLKHYQNEKTNRGQYLKGLAIDCIKNKYDDRNCHYLARELYYTEHYEKAIEMFEKHIAKPGWITEKGQSIIFMGDCYKKLGDKQKAMECYARAFTYDMGRREPLISWAQLKYENQEWVDAERLYRLALMIPKSNYYANWAPNYTHYPWGQLSVCLYNQNRLEESKVALQKALEMDPKNPVYNNNLSLYPNEAPTPKVSIIIPTLGREEKLKQVLEGIKENADYLNYEVIVMKDSFENRKGVPKLVKKGVDDSTGELVMFLANDVIPQKSFLKLAVKKMYDSFGDNMDGLVGLNDMYWHGEFATHWLASKKLLPYLGGEFFHTGYKHNGCDNELTERCRKINKYVWAEDAKILHDHPIRKDFKGEVDEVHKLARSTYKEDRALLQKRSKEFGFELRENFIHPDIKLSVVIPFKNNVVMTFEALESLIQNTTSLGEIIVIDDNSREDIQLYLKKLEKYNIPIVYKKNKIGGVNAAWNLGASLAKFRYVAIINNDILFSKDWDKPLFNTLDDNVWLVSPYHTYGKLPDDFPNGKDRHKNMDNNNIGLPFIGSCYMMEKKNLDRIMPIDERLKIWCGDNFIYEMLKTDFGKEAKEVRQSYIHHFGKKTVKGILNNVILDEKNIFDKIILERGWNDRKEYCPMIKEIDLRLKLPVKDLHKMKVLNVGVGDMTPGMQSGLSRQLPFLNFKQLDHIDIHEPYFKTSMELDWTCKNVNYIKADIKDYDFSDYDLVMAFDILEHLEKEDSLNIIKKFKNVLIFIPLEKQFRKNLHGAESQEHLSLWNEMDFSMLGFETKVLRNFHSDAERNIWDALWAWK